MILPTYTHIINPKLKHIYLSFDKGVNLVIKSPKVPLYQIENLLLKKSSWIRQTKEELESKKGKAIDFQNSPVLYFLGKPYPLVLIQYTKKRSLLNFESKVFTLKYHSYDECNFEKLIDNFYKEHAKTILPALVAKYSLIMRLYPNKISFRKTKRQWGSCNTKNDLSFNTMMMKLPEDIIQYIIIHELAHIEHKHHQESFWLRVEKTLPNYKEKIEKLKQYTT